MSKKLCYFINSAWYFELHWLDRAKAAIDAGHDVSLVARFNNTEILRKLESIGIKCFESNMKENGINPFIYLCDYLRVSKILNKINPDILHCITIKPGIISCLWCNINKKRLIYSFVGLGRVFENTSLVYKTLRFFITRLYSFLFSGIDCKVVFEHEADRNKIINIIGIEQSKTVVIDGAGINVNYFSYSEEPNEGIPKVLFASRMLWSKGLADLLKVKKRLTAEGINFEVLVAGIIVDNDSDAINLHQIEKWDQSGDITWLGTRNDIKELIQRSNIVALPSVYAEGVPRILLEAGAVGRATITYNIGGCNSLVKDGFNGAIVEKKNIVQFAEKLKTLLIDNKLRSEMGLNARKLVESKYSSDIIITETLRLYSIDNQ